MALIILLPALLGWAVLATSSARKALLYVFLPSLLLLPQYYVLRIKHLPPISFADAAILPLGAAVMMTELRRWRLCWMDLCVFLLAVSSGLSVALSAELANGQWTTIFSWNSAASLRLGTNIANGGLIFVKALLTIVAPYMVGRTLLEQRDSDGVPMRHKVVRGIVSMLAVVAVISVYDFVKGVSIWQKLAAPLKPYQSEIWEPQVRWGFGRIAGPFGHAILAGMIFLMGVIYCLWLRRADPQWGTRRIFASLPFTVRGLILAAVCAGLLMTQSRGPWIGAALALLFTGFARILPAGKAALAFLFFLAIFGAGAYVVGEHYTNTDLRSATTEEQRNAVYRRELLRSYTPVIEQRPTFGWGITDYPAMNGQQSIDNEYLLLVVTQGFFGLAAFLAIVAGTAVRLLHFMTRPLQEQDRLLVYAQLSVLIGIMTTVSTVYMGEQVVTVFFLLIGWVQAMQPLHVLSATRATHGAPRAFQRVLA